MISFLTQAKNIFLHQKGRIKKGNDRPKKATNELFLQEMIKQREHALGGISSTGHYQSSSISGLFK